MHSLVLLLLVLVSLGGSSFLVHRIPSNRLEPDVFRNFTELVESRGFKCEQHQVETEDEYLLTLFHIPPKNNNTNAPVVFLQHGLLDSSITWILNYFPEQNLPYILSEAGYDVWLGNSRGNSYSLAHKKYDIHSKEFWYFTWQDMAQYDIPAVIQYVLAKTHQQNLSYIGHSQGTIQMFAALADSPQLAAKLNSFIALGPVTTIQYMTSVFFKFLDKLHLGQILTLFGEKRFLPSFGQMSSIFAWFCEIDPIVCDNVIEFICGKHKGAFNDTRMPVVATHEPAGTSVHNMIHWSQLSKSGKFQKFDFGPEENMKRYGSPTPPLYDLSVFTTKFHLPMMVVYGDADELADPRDVANLLTKLPKDVQVIEIKNYAHLDFCWATDAHTLIYSKIVEMLQKRL